MRVSTALKIAAAAGLMVAVGVIAASKALDSKRYQAFLAERVRAASGLELSFTGPTKIKVALAPVVSFTGLTLSARPGGPAILYVDRVEARVALMPLIFRAIEMERLTLSRPVLRLGPMARPQGSMDLAQGGDKAPPTRFALSEVVVEDASLLWRDEAHSRDETLLLTKARIQPESVAGGPLSVQVEGRRDGHVFKLDGVVGSMAALLGGKPYAIQLKGSVSGAVVTASGQIAEPLQGRGLDLDLRTQGDELGELLKRLGIAQTDKPAAAIGPYRVAAHLGDGGLTEIDAVFGRRDNVLVGLKGAVRSLAALSGVDLALTAEADTLAGVSRLLAVDLPQGGPLKLSGRLNDIEGGWRLTGMKSALGRSDFAGEIALVHAPRPRFFGRLSSSVFAPADFSFPQAKASDAAKAAMPQRPAIPVMDGRVLPLEPLALDWLKAFDLTLSLSAAKLHLGPAVVSDAAAEVAMVGGRLTIDAFQGRMGEGAVRGEARLDASGRVPSAALKLSGSGLDLSSLEPGGLDGGKLDLAVDLKAVGASPRAVAASLDGGLSLGLSDGALGAAGRANPLLSALGSGDGAEDGGRLRCFALRATAKTGMVSFDRGLVADLGRAAIQGGGFIDLRGEVVDLAFVAKGGPWVRLRGALGAPVFSSQGAPPKLAPDAAACRAALKARR